MVLDVCQQAEIALDHAFRIDLLPGRDDHVEAPTDRQSLKRVVILHEPVRAGLKADARTEMQACGDARLRVKVHPAVLEVEESIAAQVSLEVQPLGDRVVSLYIGIAQKGPGGILDRRHPAGAEERATEPGAPRQCRASGPRASPVRPGGHLRLVGVQFQMIDLVTVNHVLLLQAPIMVDIERNVAARPAFGAVPDLPEGVVPPHRVSRILIRSKVIVISAPHPGNVQCSSCAQYHMDFPVQVTDSCAESIQTAEDLRQQPPHGPVFR